MVLLHSDWAHTWLAAVLTYALHFTHLKSQMSSKQTHVHQGACLGALWLGIVRRLHTKVIWRWEEQGACLRIAMDFISYPLELSCSLSECI